MPRPVGRSPSSPPSRRPPPPVNELLILKIGPLPCHSARLSRVAVGDRTGVVDHLRSHDAADDAQVVRAGGRQAGREPARHCEVGGVHRRQQQAAFPHEILQVRDAHPTEARTHVVGLIFRSEIRRVGRLLPRQRVAVHRHAVDDRPAGSRPTGGKTITSYFALRSSFFRHVCVLM